MGMKSPLKKICQIGNSFSSPKKGPGIHQGFVPLLSPLILQRSTHPTKINLPLANFFQFFLFLDCPFDLFFHCHAVCFPLSFLLSELFHGYITTEDCRIDLAPCIYAAWGEPWCSCRKLQRVRMQIWIPSPRSERSSVCEENCWFDLRTSSFDWTQVFWTFWQEMVWIVFSGCLTNNSEGFKGNEENSEITRWNLTGCMCGWELGRQQTAVWV